MLLNRVYEDEQMGILQSAEIMCLLSLTNTRC